MIENIGSEFLTISLTFAIILACMIALILTLEYVKKNRFQREKEYKGLDSQREYYEEKIYELQKQLSENERRWTDVNNLVISGQVGNEVEQEKREFILDIPFFKGLGINKQDLEIDKKSVFVLTPFVDIETKTYLVVQEVCSAVGLVCKRGDEVYRTNDILSHTIREIIHSRVVVVNINGRNPNVFYELGICHAIGKPVIIISGLKDEIPFDVISKSIVIYKDIDSLKNQLKDELLKLFIDSSSV